MLSNSIKDEIRNHYEGNKKLSFETAKKLAAMMNAGEEEDLLYPSRWRWAYRVLANVKRADLEKIVGKISERGRSDIPHMVSEVLSWTVDREAFHNGSMIGEQGIGKLPIKGRYTIMLEARLNDSTFIFDPTTLPQAVGAEAFADEMEVVSVGHVMDVTARYIRNEVDTYDKILERLED